MKKIRLVKKLIIKNTGLVNDLLLDGTKPLSQTVLTHPQWVSEWVTKFNDLLGTVDPYSPYKPCNHNLYIGIITFPHIDNAQYIYIYTGHN